MRSRGADAVTSYRKAIALSDDPAALALLGHAQGVAGATDAARQILQQLKDRREQRYVMAYDLALVELGLGDRRAALDWLEQGYADRDGFSMAVIRVAPFLQALQGDPRFEALAEKIMPARDFGEKALEHP